MQVDAWRHKGYGTVRKLSGWREFDSAVEVRNVTTDERGTVVLFETRYQEAIVRERHGCHGTVMRCPCVD